MGHVLQACVVVLRISEVEVVGLLLGSNGVDAAHLRQDATLLALATHLQVLFLHVSTGGFQHEAGNLEVAEAGLLHLGEELIGELVERVQLLQLVLQVDDVLQSCEEPLVDLRQFFDAVDGIAFLQSLGDGEDAQIGGILQGVVEVVEACVVVAHEAVHALANHAQTLLNHLLECAADGHDLTHRLHRRANETAHTGKLRQVPARNLTNHVVEARSHIGRLRRSHLTNLVEGIAQRNLCCHEGEWITRGLRCQRT